MARGAQRLRIIALRWVELVFLMGARNKEILRFSARGVQRLRIIDLRLVKLVFLRGEART